MNNVGNIEKNAIALGRKYGIGDNIYEVAEKEQAFYVINTSGSSGPAGALFRDRGALSLAISVTENRETVVKISDTFAPINLAEQVSIASLMNSSIIRRQISGGMISPISADTAKALLAQPIIQQEVQRLQNQEIRLRNATSIEDDVVVTRKSRSDIEDDSIEGLDTLNITKSKETKIKKKKSSTRRKIQQIITEVNDGRNEEEALQTLIKLQERGKLKDEHYMALISSVDRKYKKVREFAKEGL